VKKGTKASPDWHWTRYEPGGTRGYNQSVEFVLRDFRPQEFETVWRIDQNCFPPGVSYSRLEFAAYLRRPGAFCLVAESSPIRGEISGAILGFIVAETGSRGSGHIITIDVLPNARGVGVGSSLLRAAEERLRAANCHGVILETAVDNRSALSFYKRSQYHVVNTIPRYYSNGVDALVLKKDLLSAPPPANLPQ
jgi:[ribosomal protein S18]-alanine N-acetyltransferase